MLKEHPALLFTVFVHASMYEKVQAVLGSNVGDASQRVDLSRARIIGVGAVSKEGGLGATLRYPIEIDAAIQANYPALFNGGDITCSVTQSALSFNNITPPTLVISDLFSSISGKIVKEITPSVKLLMWFSSTTMHFIDVFGPEELSGKGDLEKAASAVFSDETQRAGRSLVEIATSLVENRDSKIVDIPGIPLMYDYEMTPQQPFLPPMTQMFLDAVR